LEAWRLTTKHRHQIALIAGTRGKRSRWPTIRVSTCKDQREFLVDDQLTAMTPRKKSTTRELISAPSLLLGDVLEVIKLLWLDDTTKELSSLEMFPWTLPHRVEVGLAGISTAPRTSAPLS
jgi:hypothetical protein